MKDALERRWPQMRMRTRSGPWSWTVALVVGVIVLSTSPVAAQTTTAAGDTTLSVLNAIILGLVEGITEYLPVSSTGHLLVTNNLLGLEEPEVKEAIETYAICIQLGAIIAVLFLYWGRIRQMLDGLLGRDEEGRKVLIAVLIAFAFTAAIGLTLGEWFEDNVFGVGPIAAAWIVGGIAIIVLSRIGFFDRTTAELAALTPQKAAIIGLLQALAMWPGVSRSMITIFAAVLVGLSLRAAVEFSFLLGLLTLTAATVLVGYRGGGELVDTFGYVTPLIGLIVAFVSAMAAVKWMVAWLNDRGFELFGWYRIAVGVLALLLLAAGAV